MIKNIFKKFIILILLLLLISCHEDDDGPFAIFNFFGDLLCIASLGSSDSCHFDCDCSSDDDCGFNQYCDDYCHCEYGYNYDVILGCTDENACNYMHQANVNDDSCIYYVDDCGICDGNNINENDFYCSDVKFVEELKSQNPGLFNGINLYTIPNDIILWTEMNSIYRITNINITDNNYLNILPQSVSNLDELSWLVINNTDLYELPGTLCSLPNSTQIHVDNNHLCDEYYFSCITYWGFQNQSDCCIGYNNQGQLVPNWAQCP